MVKVNGTGCCQAAWGQMEWMCLSCLLHIIGIMQAVDGGQLLHGHPYPRIHPATAFVQLFSSLKHLYQCCYTSMSVKISLNSHVQSHFSHSQ